MVLPNNTLYAPYGAYELKACYQRHMLLALGLTYSGVLLALSICWVLSFLRPVPEIVLVDDGLVVDPITITAAIPVQPTIVRDGPGIQIDRPKPPSDDRSEQLVPVADSQLSDDGDMLPTTDERRDMIGPGIDGNDGYDSSKWSFDSSTVFDVEPGPDSFIVCEVYPEMIYEAQPEFPRLAQQMGLDGVVHIKALVGSDGSVRKAVVYCSSGNELLDEAALKVASLNRFRPAIQSNRPVAVWVVYKVAFSLE